MSVSENSKDRTNGNGNDLEFADGDFIVILFEHFILAVGPPTVWRPVQGLGDLFSAGGLEFWPDGSVSHPVAAVCITILPLNTEQRRWQLRCSPDTQHRWQQDQSTSSNISLFQRCPAMSCLPGGDYGRSR